MLKAAAFDGATGEAANMKVRADLLSALKSRISSWAVSQETAAARLGITRPRINDLMRGKVDKFSLDALVNLAEASGLAFEISISEPISLANLESGK